MKKGREGRGRKEGRKGEGRREWRRKEISLNYSIRNTKIHLNFGSGLFRHQPDRLNVFTV